MRGELLALIYADNDGQHGRMESTDTPARVADIVRRHTALRLDRLTVELKTMGELSAYARMLLDEVEYVYRADVSARKPDSERLERLTENLRCARQIYQQRVAVEGPAMAALIEEVITAAVAAKAGTPFGRELASVAPQAHPGSHGSRRAEVSEPCTPGNKKPRLLIRSRGFDERRAVGSKDPTLRHHF